MRVYAAVFIFFAAVAHISASSAGGQYGGGSMPALPCPKNYLFSCQPSLSPAPCSQASYGSTGAYSDNVPTYFDAPPYYHQGVHGLYGYGQGLGVQAYQY